MPIIQQKSVPSLTPGLVRRTTARTAVPRATLPFARPEATGQPKLLRGAGYQGHPPRSSQAHAHAAAAAASMASTHSTGASHGGGNSSAHH